jgi:ubiquinone/menaquinone biosynthesis C-methylase UbiE
MNESEITRIKKKFAIVNSRLFWGDDYDVRFYLLSKLKQIRNSVILDVGGGIGITCSELDKSNFCVNLDSSYNDLRMCNEKVAGWVNVINGSMTNLPLKENYFDYVICSHLLEIAKLFDIENNLVVKNQVNQYPTVNKVLSEICSALKPGGTLLITTPNNAYYKSTKLTYYELQFHLKENFENFSIYFYNTFPRLKSKNRRLNLANVIPKVMSKIIKREKIIHSLIHKDKGMDQYSVSFFVEAKK